MATYSVEQYNSDGTLAYTLYLTLSNKILVKSIQSVVVDYDLSLQCHNDFYSYYELGYDIKVGGTTLATSAAEHYDWSDTITIAAGTGVIPQGVDLSVTATVQSIKSNPSLPSGYYAPPTSMIIEGTFSTPVINNYVNVNGVMKSGRIWINNHGAWRRGVPWVKVNGLWK